MTTIKWGSALHLTKALFAQDSIWITSESRTLKIADMRPTHALNTLLMLERLDDLPFRGESLHATPLYGALKDRVLVYLPPDEGTLNLDPVPTGTAATNVRFQVPPAGPAVDRDDYRRLVTKSLIEQMLRQAITPEGSDRVKIKYVDADGIATERDIYPHSWIDYPKMVKAFDVLRDAPRTFRLDRIEWAEGKIRL